MSAADPDDHIRFRSRRRGWLDTLRSRCVEGDRRFAAVALGSGWQHAARRRSRTGIDR